MEAPLFVIVSGAPGSGKTTLATQLAAHMRLLHVPRDEFFWGMTYTANAHINRGAEGINTFYDVLRSLGEKGVSLVTDGTIYKGISEPDITSKLAPIARLVNVHCRAENVNQRFYNREVARYGQATDELEEHLKHLDKIYADTAEPLQLDCPVLEVDTNGIYNPSLAEIAEWIGDRNSELSKRAAYRGKRTQ